MMSARFTRSHGFGSWIPMTKASCGSLSQSQPCNRGQRSPPSLYHLSHKHRQGRASVGLFHGLWRPCLGLGAAAGRRRSFSRRWSRRRHAETTRGRSGYRARIEGRGQRKSLTTGQYIVYIARRENVYSTVRRARGRSKQPALIPASLLFKNLGHVTGEGGPWRVYWLSFWI
jgi:hypothetical protein